jgi:hypothetical protein
MEGPGFGLQITPEQVDMMAGVFTFSKDTLERYRAAVLNDRLGKALDAAVAKVRVAGAYTVAGETYKRIPTGLPADHPRASWLKFTGLHAYAPSISLDVAATPALVDAAMAHFLDMSPLYLWLREVMG